MLTHLCLRHFLLFEQADIPVTAGFTAITGETGAGKSILLQALHLVTGGRLDRPVTRPNHAEAVVIARFDVTLPWLAEYGIDPHDGLILKRIITAARTSRAFINDQPVSLKLLRDVGASLLDIHGQHDTHTLLEPAQHRRLLDSGLADGGLLDAVAQAHRAWQEAMQAEADAAKAIAEAKAEEDYWRLALQEFEELNPYAGEEDELAAQRQTLLAKQQERQHLQQAHEQIDGIPTRPIHWAADTLKEYAAKDATLAPLAEMLATAAINLEEAQHDLAKRVQADDGAGAELERIDQRWHELKALTRKYRLPLSELPRLFVEAKAKVALLESGQIEAARLAKATQQAWQHYEQHALALRAARGHAATAITKALNTELVALLLPKATFAIALTEAEPSAHGMDAVCFMLQTNPGHPPTPLHKGASGGEMARVMLAFKAVLAGMLPPTTLVFDEVDTGVGGQVATAIGQRLRQLSTQKQVLSITHAPQVASLADTHWQLAKQQGSKHTTSIVRVLDIAQRREEVARMLSGQTVTTAARAAADDLLEATHA